MINKIFLSLFCLTTTIVSGQSKFITAEWIVPGFKEDTMLWHCPIYTQHIDVRKGLRSATLYITAHGLYEAHINAQRVGDAYFTPGFTSYNKRLQYQQYDVKSLLKKGTNTINVTVGEGWYRGAFGGSMENNTYGNDAGLLLQLELTYNDGSTATIISDDKWLCTTGPIVYSGIYEGELYDARIQPAKGTKVQTATYPKDILVPTTVPPVREKETFHPINIRTTPNGEQVIDFGQNLAGWVHFSVKGKAGDTIRIYHAETLDKAGNFYTGNLRDAKATDTYILTGKGKETFQPHFTWHGFRYAKVVGCKANAADFTARALYSDLAPAGSFSCSDTLLNKLVSNMSWSLKGNFLDIPTDCPQRSERLGWTGDAQVFCRTASYLFHVDAFFGKYLQDLEADQAANGAVPSIIPDVYKKYRKDPRTGTAGWADAATIIPWTMYWVYGDTAVLSRQYNSMKAWVDYIGSVNKNGLWTANGYGDWYAAGDSTSLPYIDQCFWAYSTQLLMNTAKVLGRTSDVEKYTASLKDIKSAFLKTYTEGFPNTNTQTACILALQFDMLPDSISQRNMAARLAKLVIANNNHLATGFLGTPHLLHALTRYGYTDLAYKVLHQETFPSWLYPVKMGATTIWEKWNAIKPDSTVQATSFNHYSYGAVGEWLYRVVAGIDAASAGYQHITIAPHPGGGLTWVNASYHCPYGKIVSNWKITDGQLKVHIEIPAGTTATVTIPGKEAVEVTAGTYDY